MACPHAPASELMKPSPLVACDEVLTEASDLEHLWLLNLFFFFLNGSKDDYRKYGMG